MTDILITGGSGAFGHAFVRRLLNAPGGRYDRVIVYSRDEVKQFHMAQEFDDPRMRFFIGDVRDAQRLRRALEGVDVVVHAAALKRIEVGHYNPLEMVKTNVFGTVNLIEAAMDAKVAKVVALSTDKAYQPVSPYGCSKAMMESLILAANNMSPKDGPRFAATRYGNIAGSTGSVIPTWRAILAMAKTVVPVTDPNCTRFWMTIDEAVDLVLNTIDTMVGGELVIPELKAYRLGDLAVAMGATGALEIGLPAWEKQHECMREGQCSFDLRIRMTIPELREALKHVG